jgi:methylmalonyl-CoA mutase N-terminal domain/subunit
LKKRGGFREMTESNTRSGIPLKSVYTPGDVKNLDYDRHLGAPGEYPYTRGRRASAVGGWMQRELSGEGEPSRSNEQLKYLISKGQIGLDVIGDSPTMAHMDPDHPLAAHAVGTQGVSLCCLDDYRELLRDIPLDSAVVSCSLPASIAAASLNIIAGDNNVPLDKLRGSVIQAPFYVEDCGYASHMPFRLRLRLSVDCIKFCTEQMPRFHSFVEDTYFIAETGLNAADEMALGFIEIRYIIRELLKSGMDIDSFAPRIGVLVNCSMDFFEEVAKIRATRRLFARMMREEFGAKDPRSWSAVITCHTSGLSLTAQQPVNNIVRGTLQSLALVMAGVQAMELSAFDEAYRTPSPESHTVGLRTQQIIQLESNVGKVVDPLGGSYFIESLTDEMEKRIWSRVLEIEAMGDPEELSDKGWFKRYFEEAMGAYSQKIVDGSLPKVGLNIFQIPEEEDTLLKEVVESKIEPCRSRIDDIKRFKEGRDQARIKDVLLEVCEKSRDEEENLIHITKEALLAGATMGEIAGMMRIAYGVPYDPLGMTESPL